MTSPLMTNRVAKLVRVGVMLGILMAFGLSGAAFADDLNGSSTVTGGILEMDAPDAPSVSVTLDGTDKAPTDEFDIDVNDARGNGAGWNLQITSTAFADGSHSLANDAAAITGVTFDCDQGTCTDPTNAISYTALTVPADTTAPLAVKFFNAAANTGMGDFTITPTLEVSIPANTYAGDYESTMTVSIVSGP